MKRMGFGRSTGVCALVAALAASACTSGDDGAGEAEESPGTPEAGNQEAASPQHFYVVNTEGESLSVIDHAARAVVATIDLGNKPHGQAPANDGRRIYVTTDGGHGEVVAIDTADQSVQWRIDVGEDMNEPHLTVDGRLLYAPDLLAGQVVVIDVDRGEATREIPMATADGGQLVALHNTYASHDGRFIYVTAILSDAIARIDTSTNEVDRLYALSGAPRPAAITDDDRKMYVQLSDLHGFVELDLETGEETAKVEWPEPSPLPPDYLAYSGLPTKCHGIGISPDGKELWAGTNIEGRVYVYSLPDLEQLDRLDVGGWPNWIAFSRSGDTVYVTNSEVLAEHGTVSVIDRQGRTVEQTLDVGAIPKRIHRVDLPPGQ